MQYNKIGIGTAQWGARYGVSNIDGQTSIDQSKLILDIARKASIKLIDTSALYGNAEATIGESDLETFKIVTKVRGSSDDALYSEVKQRIMRCVAMSLERMRTRTLYGLLIHDADSLLLPGSEHLVETLLMLKEKGIVKKVGLSVYNSRQVERACMLFTPDIIQLPVNVFDQRLLLDGTIKSLANKGVEIHARSVFLQGLLLMEPSTVPSYFSRWRPNLDNWHQLCSEIGVLPQIAALKWACDIPEVSYTLVGIQNPSQLEQLLEFPPKLPQEDLNALAMTEEELLNPSIWQL